MSWHASLYFFVGLPFCLIYALLRGGWPEKASATILLIGSLATMAARLVAMRTFTSIEIDVLVIDLATLAGFAWVALCSDRFWPLCTAGLQASTIAVHFLRAISPALSPFAYQVGTKSWGFGLLATIIVGTARYRRRRTRLR